MGSTDKPGAYDCAAKAKPNEPTFTLLARDPVAGETVRAWADKRERALDLGIIFDTPAERDQIAEARDCAKAMDEYLFKAKPTAAARVLAPKVDTGF